MSNYPPPPPYGGQYFAAQKGAYTQAGNGNYAMHFQPQHMPQPQHPYQSHYPVGMAAAQAAQYANAAAYAQNQFHHVPPPPPHPYAYQYSLPNTSQPYAHGQAQPAVPSHFSHSNPGPSSASSLIAPQPFAQPSSEQWTASNVSTNNDGRDVAMTSQWSYAHAPDATDEAINRALATANAVQPMVSTHKPGTSPQQESTGKQIGEKDAINDQSAAAPAVPESGKEHLQPASQSQPLAALPGLTPPQMNASLAIEGDSNVQPSNALRKTWEGKRNQAIAALGDMLKGGLTLDQLSKEGLDPNLLTNLQVDASPDWRNSRLPYQADSARSLESGEVSEDDLYDNGPPNRTIPGTKSPPPTDSQQPMIQQLQDSSPKKNEERKDYIARLLAAKQAVAKPAIPALDGTASTRAEPARPLDSPSTPTVQSKDAPKRSEAKDPVQTELVRKRLEALKANNRPAPIQTTVSQPQGPSSVDAHAYPISQHRYVPIQEEETRSGGEPMYTPRSNSFYADGDQGFAGLPGLSPVLVKPPFTGEERPQHTATVADALRDELKRAEAPRSTISLRDPVPIEYAPQPKPISPASTPHSQSRKRAMASDFIDSPPRAKRRTAPEDDIKVVIDVSDEEEGEINSSTQFKDLPTAVEASIPGAISERNNAGVSTPKSLMDLEAEMKAMKEKIAERQRKRKAQEVVVASVGSNRASDSGHVSPSTIISEVEQKSKQQQRTLAVSRTKLQEKLEAERKTHALITAQAENERRQAANASTVSERDQRLDRKAILEASIPKLDASIEATLLRMESMRKQQDAIQEELERGRRERQAMIDELDKLCSSEMIPSTSHLPATSGEREEQHETHKRQTPESDVPAQVDQPSEQPSEQPSSNQSSADLPVCNRRTPETVSSHAESDENLMEDDMDISKSSEDEAELGNYDRSRTDSLYETHPQDPRLGQLRAEASMPVSGATSRDERNTDLQDEYELSLDGQFSDDDDKEDIESGVVVNAQEAYPETSADNQDDEESEEFESDEVEQRLSGELRDPTAAALEEAKEKGNVPQVTETAHESPVQQGSEEGEITEDEGESSDDYEPREAETVIDPGKEIGISQGGARATDSLPRETSEADGEVVVGTEQRESNETQGSHKNRGHFQPYESPLIRFHSYRFHPQYVASVPGGFTSLTFSHHITDTPLCRWETSGGICNDSTCAYQHFRDLPLTGNAMLLQLGSTPEGNTPDEKARYQEGLHALLSAMNESDGANDADTVAAAIVAYRAQFLNDATRIVPLPSEPTHEP